MKDEDALRLAAINRVKTLTQVYGDDIPWNAISQGFDFQGERILLANKAVGIFKPNQMKSGALSIKTTMPRAGREKIYFDAEDADGTFVYKLQGDNPNNHFNKSLAHCHVEGLPLIYFHAVDPSIYKAIFPCFIESIDPINMSCRVSVASSPNFADTPNLRDSLSWAIERRYTLRETKTRLHQAEFREQVLSAYDRQCAMTRLPVPELLEAAHIVADSHELGVAEIRNGICLSRIHHRAFDSNLIGVSPDFKIHVSPRLLEISDGILLEGSLKALHGNMLSLPQKKAHWPNKDLLTIRFDEFQKWVWV